MLVAALSLFHISCQFADIQVSNKRSINDLIQLISKAIVVDNDLASWAVNIPKSWNYKTSTVNRENWLDMSYGDRYHIYHSSWVACMWNSYRLCRTLVHCTIISAINELFTLIPSSSSELMTKCYSQLSQSEEALAGTVDDIRASVPYQLNLELPPQSFQRGDAYANAMVIPRPSTVFNLLLLLQAVTTSTDTSKLLGKWFPRTLTHIGTQLGVGHAIALGKTTGWL